MSKSISKLEVTIPDVKNCCWANLRYNFDSSLLKIYKEYCTDSTITWQFLNTVTDTFEDILSSDPGFISSDVYNPFETGAKGVGTFRLKIENNYSCTLFSNLAESFAP